MKQKIVIFIVLVAISFLAMAVYAQDPTTIPAQELLTSKLDLSSLATDLVDGAFWIAIIITLIAGAVGGVVYELLILQGNIELPHKPEIEELTEKYPHAIGKFIYDLGIFARVIVGAMAAVAALLFLTPETSFELLAMAIVAGSAGTSIFRSMQDRLSAAMARKDVADIRSLADKQNEKVKQSREAVKSLRTRLEETLGSKEGTITRGMGGLGSKDFDELEGLLNEAIGIHEGGQAE